MDRRQEKTRKAIMDAFLELLEQKSYAKITVQEILDRANVGRSTFYAHFETKDSLLDEMCSEIFTHVFSEHLYAEESHDFTGDPYDYTQQITHILYHLKDHGMEITRLLNGESGDLFMSSMKSYLPEIFDAMIRDSGSEIPESYLQNYLAGSFADTIRWWVRRRMQDRPEEVAGYYITVVEKGILGEVSG